MPSVAFFHTSISKGGRPHETPCCTCYKHMHAVTPPSSLGSCEKLLYVYKANNEAYKLSSPDSRPEAKPAIKPEGRRPSSPALLHKRTRQLLSAAPLSNGCQRAKFSFSTKLSVPLAHAVMSCPKPSWPRDAEAQSTTRHKPAASFN